jgi:hypothetical protein
MSYGGQLSEIKMTFLTLLEMRYSLFEAKTQYKMLLLFNNQ